MGTNQSVIEITTVGREAVQALGEEVRSYQRALEEANRATATMPESLRRITGAISQTAAEATRAAQGFLSLGSTVVKGAQALASFNGSVIGTQVNAAALDRSFTSLNRGVVQNAVSAAQTGRAVSELGVSLRQSNRIAGDSIGILASLADSFRSVRNAASDSTRALQGHQAARNIGIPSTRTAVSGSRETAGYVALDRLSQSTAASDASEAAVTDSAIIEAEIARKRKASEERLSSSYLGSSPTLIAERASNRAARDADNSLNAIADHLHDALLVAIRASGALSPEAERAARSAQKAAIAAADDNERYRLNNGLIGPLAELSDAREKALDKKQEEKDQFQKAADAGARAAAQGAAAVLKADSARVAANEKARISNIVDTTVTRVHDLQATRRPYNIFATVDDERGRLVSEQETLQGGISALGSPSATNHDALKRLHDELDRVNESLQNFDDKLQADKVKAAIEAQTKAAEAAAKATEAQQRAMEEADKKRQEAADRARQTDQQQFEKVAGPIRNTVNGAFESWLHGDKKGLQKGALALGDQISDAATSAFITQLTSPLVGGITAQVMAMKLQTDAVRANTDALLVRPLPNPSPAGKSLSSSLKGGTNTWGVTGASTDSRSDSSSSSTYSRSVVDDTTNNSIQVDGVSAGLPSQSRNIANALAGVAAISDIFTNNGAPDKSQVTNNPIISGISQSAMDYMGYDYRATGALPTSKTIPGYGKSPGPGGLPASAGNVAAVFGAVADIAPLLGGLSPNGDAVRPQFPSVSRSLSASLKGEANTGGGIYADGADTGNFSGPGAARSLGAQIGQYAGAALAGYSVFNQGAQNGTTVGGVVNGAITGAQVGGSIGGPMGAGIGAVAGGLLDVIGGLFHHTPDKSQIYNNPSVYGDPSGFDYMAYRYRATGQLPTSHNIPNYSGSSTVAVNMYMDGVAQAVKSVVGNATSGATNATTNSYLDLHKPY